MCRFALAAFAVTVMTACGPATELTEQQKAEIEQEVRGLEDDLIAYAGDADAERFLSLFAQSEDLTFAMYGAVHSSWSTWDSIVKRGFARIEEADVESCEWSDRHYQVLGRSVAVSTEVARCFGPTAAGSPKLVDHTWSAVWVRRDGRWRIANFAETYPRAESGG